MRAISLETEDTIADNEIIGVSLQCLMISVEDQLWVNASRILGFRPTCERIAGHVRSALPCRFESRVAPLPDNVFLCWRVSWSTGAHKIPASRNTHAHETSAPRGAQIPLRNFAHIPKRAPLLPLALKTLPDERERDLARPSVSPIITE